MPTLITTKTAIEKSSFVITVAFFDANGDEAVPNDGLNWTLTNSAGSIINSRKAVSITPAASVDIVLSGLDLSFLSSEAQNLGTFWKPIKFQRVLTVEGTYDSDEGTNLPIKEECIFTLQGLVAVA